MLNLVRLKYDYYFKIAVSNKRKLKLRNNSFLIFKETEKHINKL